MFVGAQIAVQMIIFFILWKKMEYSMLKSLIVAMLLVTVTVQLALIPVQ